ncbi:ABC transporter substrate-binding protein [Chitinimonas naiadis]
MRAIPYLLLVSASLASLAARPLVICADADPEGFDPAQFASVSTHTASAFKLYNKLIEYLPGPWKLSPSLAERWDISPDGLVYTFHLRRGVKWQRTPWFTPSREFNADDVLWTLKRQIDPKHPGAKAAPAGFPYALAGDWKSLFKSVDKLDDYTVRLSLNRPYAPLLIDMAGYSMDIVSAEYAQQLDRAGTPTQISSLPVGTGPYAFNRYDKGAQVRYTANPDYWRQKPAIDKLMLVIVPDPAVRAQKLRAGECQLAESIKPQDLPRFTSDARFALTPRNLQLSALLFFNVTRKPLDDKRVRQALAMSIDRAAIVKTVYDGQAEPAGTLYSARSLWGVLPARPTVPDWARAKQLLREAGYPEGFEIELGLRAGGSGVNPNSQLTGELIQADWARLGVKLKLVSMEAIELTRRSRAGEVATVLGGWGFALDPDNFYSNQLSCDAIKQGYNAAQWCNPKAEAALDAARAATRQADRIQRYEAVQQLVAEEVPLTPLAFPVPQVVYDKRLGGVASTPNESFKVEQLYWR